MVLVRARAIMQKVVKPVASRRSETVFLQQHQLAALASVLCVIRAGRVWQKKLHLLVI